MGKGDFINQDFLPKDEQRGTKEFE